MILTEGRHGERAARGQRSAHQSQLERLGRDAHARKVEVGHRKSVASLPMLELAFIVCADLDLRVVIICRVRVACGQDLLG